MQSTHAVTTNLLPAADAAMRDGLPDANYGGALVLPVGVGGFGSPTNRALLRFSFANLPTNAVIASAALRLIVSVAGRLPADFELKRLLTDWAEGEATWNLRFAPATPWSAGGAQTGTDFIPTPSATGQLGDPGSTNEFSSPGLAADVQMWVQNPGANYGWILMAAGELAGTGKQIGSHESDTNTPVLTVEYSVPGLGEPAMPPTIFGTTGDGNTLRFSFNAESNRTYAVEFKDSLSVTNWSVLTNIPELPTGATIHITNTVDSAQRYFRARTP